MTTAKEPGRISADSSAMAEEPLFGGLVDKVVRVGSTVRRPAGPWTPTTQALLAHLHAAGFPCPQPLGFDDQGREVLSYLEGAPMMGPMPALVAEEGCSAIGRFIRAFHDAQAGFVAPNPPVWQAGMRAVLPGEVVLHGDLGPTNLLFHDGEVVGLIDWDMAYPGWGLSDLTDIAGSLIPLQPPPTDPSRPNPGLAERHDRLVALAEGYGLVDLIQLTEFVRVRRDGARRMRIQGRSGVEPWSTFLDRGLADRCERQAGWVEENFEDLLGGP